MSFLVSVETVVICTLEGKGKAVGDEIQTLVDLDIDIQCRIVVLFISVAEKGEVTVPVQLYPCRD